VELNRLSPYEVILPRDLDKRLVRPPTDPLKSIAGLYRRTKPRAQMAKVAKPKKPLQQHLHISAHFGMQYQQQETTDHQSLIPVR